MQGHQFMADVRVLKLADCQMVLGVNSLRDLSPVTFNFRNLTLQFTHEGVTIQLQGTTNRASLRVIGVEVLEEFTNLEDPWMAQLNIMQGKLTSKHIPSPIWCLLLQNTNLFKEPGELPPSRVHDHKITLKPNSQPVNLRPYRYPYHHKTELEKQVKEMLEVGIIRPNQSAYASPALLVGKKDGTLRMCIDYRRLNSMSIKDKFPSSACNSSTM